MGLNLIVYRREGGRFVDCVAPDLWDTGRHAGDRDFAAQVLGDDALTVSIREDGYEGERYFRPRDVDGWKAWDAAYECNNGRWSALADLLAGDPALFVYPSW